MEDSKSKSQTYIRNIRTLPQAKMVIIAGSIVDTKPSKVAGESRSSKMYQANRNVAKLEQASGPAKQTSSIATPYANMYAQTKQLKLDSTKNARRLSSNGTM